MTISANDECFSLYKSIKIGCFLTLDDHNRTRKPKNFKSLLETMIYFATAFVTDTDMGLHTPRSRIYQVDKKACNIV